MEDTKLKLKTLQSVNNMIWREVRRYWVSEFAKDDLYQAGLMGAFEALSRYNKKRKTRYSTFAYYWIRKRIREEALTLAKRHEFIEYVDHYTQEIHPKTKRTHSHELYQAEHHSINYELIKCATIRKAVRLILLLDLSLTEAATMLGVRKQYISKGVKDLKQKGGVYESNISKNLAK